MAQAAAPGGGEADAQFPTSNQLESFFSWRTISSIFVIQNIFGGFFWQGRFRQTGKGATNLGGAPSSIPAANLTSGGPAHSFGWVPFFSLNSEVIPEFAHFLNETACYYCHLPTHRFPPERLSHILPSIYLFVNFVSKKQGACCKDKNLHMVEWARDSLVCTPSPFLSFASFCRNKANILSHSRV